MTVLDAERSVAAADQALAINCSQISQDQIAVTGTTFVLRAGALTTFLR